MAAFARGFQSFALLIARIALGATLLWHAWWRWRVMGVDFEIAYLTQHGVPYPAILAWAAIICEAGGGILLVLGLLTRVVGAGVLVMQVMIICWTKFYRGIFTDNGYAANVMLGATGLIFLAFGAGAVGVDALFRRTKEDGDSTDYANSEYARASRKSAA